MVARQAVLFNKSTAGNKGIGCYICGESGHAGKVCPTLKGGNPSDPPQKYKGGKFEVVKPKGGEIVGLKKRLPAKPEEAPKKPAASAVRGGRKAENDERG
eukprot:CAMPEP_0173067186 /NCGR_PEP_ID=MMETSP1102-20130122/6664_1 /TAXON_ID=49646 /ORGANISM="Geminigera sp., Strain Caron Lab Isolate" /LENGTH=99 /DNA_ID=CAMNT_0013934801 /DNA_START=40 /DNA_END=335 /DNA_ORIENTATION=-